MTVKTYNEILTDLCNTFDSLISPKSIKRTNTNVIYLIFKAIAKSLEVINNVVVALDNKFDPATCDDSDLDSVAKLVGTERRAGSGSGLAITITNPTNDNITLPVGEYTYNLDSDTTFIFTLSEEVTVYPESETLTDTTKMTRYIAMTRTIGSFPVTAQDSITVTCTQDDIEIELDSNLVFSNADNSTLLGRSKETALAFRTRILENSTRQNVIEELEEELLALPYIINCKIVFNQTDSSVAYNDYTIPAYTMLISIDGDVTTEVADIIASYGIFPTLQTDDSKMIKYESDVFATGYYPIYYKYFDSFEYAISIIYEIDKSFTSATIVETAISKAIYSTMNDNTYKQIIKEGDIYDIIKALSLEAFTLLSVELQQDGTRCQYLDVPKTQIPRVTSISYTERS